MNRTKVMISVERQKAARWPCGVCGRGVTSNSIQCTTTLLVYPLLTTSTLTVIYFWRLLVEAARIL